MAERVFRIEKETSQVIWGSIDGPGPVGVDLIVLVSLDELSQERKIATLEAVGEDAKRTRFSALLGWNDWIPINVKDVRALVVKAKDTDVKVRVTVLDSRQS